MHAHSYLEPDIFPGKRVLVLGIGNSACDIAVEASRIAEKTFLAMRRGAHIVPKFIGGKPTDETSGAWFARLPLPVQRTITTMILRSAQGKMTDYGLPQPDHKLLEAHPTVSSDLLPHLGHGDISVKPNIARFDKHEVVFEDGKPGADRPGDLLHRLQDHLPVLRREPHQRPRREDARMRERYVASKRHTVQVNFHPYPRTIARERWRRPLIGKLTGALGSRSHELRLGHPSQR